MSQRSCHIQLRAYASLTVLSRRPQCVDGDGKANSRIEIQPTLRRYHGCSSAGFVVKRQNILIIIIIVNLDTSICKRKNQLVIQNLVTMNKILIGCNANDDGRGRSTMGALYRHNNSITVLAPYIFIWHRVSVNAGRELRDGNADNAVESLRLKQAKTGHKKYMEYWSGAKGWNMFNGTFIYCNVRQLNLRCV